ncbi:MAG: hypothetical protein EBU90_14460 [Proteobacteria bacterium]|nr:hypothetical protein [Pseudomonadota bacterium]NBP15372.1 hypothetical protein [bacterium]
MKLHTGTHVVEKSGKFEENQFSIEASAKAFMILSDGLYSNKILAVVRELSTNAYDSHVDAKCTDKPFEVHLPNRLEPYFHVRDFGTSMSHENCMTLYTTYFRSTRNNSNDSVGCLGLGSKAPFAYTDSFTVEAYLDGKKRIYSAHRDNNGNPTFALLDTIDTDEANGIKVAMPVRNDDMDAFRREAQRVYRYFKVRPIITGNNDIYFHDEDTLLKAEDGSWEFNTGDSSNLIIMGQIAYPIYNDNISSRYVDEDKVGNFLWHSQGLRLYVNIGDVDITPSRESLSYTQETKKNIRSLVEKVINDIKDTVENTIKSQPTLYLARKKFLEIENQCSSVKSAMESLNNAIEWNGKKIFDSMVGNKIEVEGLGIKQFYKSGYRSKAETNKDVKSIPLRNDCRFYIDDCERGGLGRIRQELKENFGANGYTAYIYTVADGETVNANRLLKVLGDATIDDVILTSSLPKVQRKSSGGSGSTVDYSQVEYYDEESGKILWENMSVKFEDAVYIPTRKGECTIGHRTFDQSSIIKIIGYIYQDIGTDKTFYFLTPSQIKTRKLEERDNWEGSEYLLQLIKDLGAYHSEDINNIRNQHSIGSEYGKYKDVFKMTSSNNKAKEIILAYEAYHESIEKNYHKMDDIWRICNTLGFNTNSSQSKIDTEAQFKKPLTKEIKKYPMLNANVLNALWHDDQRRAVANYIDMIEEAQVLTMM